MEDTFSLELSGTGAAWRICSKPFTLQFKPASSLEEGAMELRKDLPALVLFWG